MTALKPGVQTSEFALTIGGIIASLLVTFGVIQVNQIDQISKLIADAVTGITALVVIWHLVITYVNSRTELKNLSMPTTNPVV